MTRSAAFLLPPAAAVILHCAWLGCNSTACTGWHVGPHVQSVGVYLVTINAIMAATRIGCMSLVFCVCSYITVSAACALGVKDLFECACWR